MASDIHTVAVIGCGVIGAGWAALFLSNGLKVLIVDPVAEAQDAFKTYIDRAWPALEASVPSCQDSHASNYEFIKSIDSRLSEVDYVQEVTAFLYIPAGQILTAIEWP